MNFYEWIYYIFEMIGIVAFAVSGAMVAISKRVDVFGVVLCGVITALGSGIIRDILIGISPPKFFSSYEYVLGAVITSIAVFLIAFIFLDKYQQHSVMIDTVNNIFDAIGLGIFTVTGAKVAYVSGFTTNGILVVSLATITGIGGGILRDLMLKEIPFVLKKRVYALASIIGATIYHLLYTHSVSYRVATVITVVVVFVIRICATVFEWDLPSVKLKNPKQ